MNKIYLEDIWKRKHIKTKWRRLVYKRDRNFEKSE